MKALNLILLFALTGAANAYACDQVADCEATKNCKSETISKIAQMHLDDQMDKRYTTKAPNYGDKAVKDNK